MSDPVKNDPSSEAQALLELIEDHEQAAHYSDGDLVAVRRMQSDGISDADIEHSLGMRLLPADRRTYVWDDSALKLGIRWKDVTRKGKAAADSSVYISLSSQNNSIIEFSDNAEINSNDLLTFFAENWISIFLSGQTAHGIKLLMNGERSESISFRRFDKLITIKFKGKYWSCDIIAFKKAVDMALSAVYSKVSHKNNLDIAQKWESRDEIPLPEALDAYLGFKSELISNLIMKNFVYKDADSLISTTNPALIAARMTLSHNRTEEDVKKVIRIIASTKKYKYHEKMIRHSEECKKFLDTIAQKTPHNQGSLVAQEIRKLNNIKINSPINARDLLKEYGLVLLEIKFHESIDAIAVWGDTHGPAIILNQDGIYNQTAGGESATISHELCHFLVDRDVTLSAVEVLGGQVSSFVEARARAFAAELLLPKAAAKSMPISRNNMKDSLNRICIQYGVSQSLCAWQIIHSSAVHPYEIRKFLKDVAEKYEEKKFRSFSYN